jgi:NAD(P)-dependent dehydrogenase (short-subunit alcohol dehydrogenase family)
VGATPTWPLPTRSLEVNLFGAWRLTNALLPLLGRSDHPRIVNVSSAAGSHGDAQFGRAKRGGRAATYGISKAALALTSTLGCRARDAAWGSGGFQYCEQQALSTSRGLHNDCPRS